MRLNDSIITTDAPRATDIQSVLTGILDDITSSLAIDACTNLNSVDLSDECKVFFENYYVKPDQNGKIVCKEIANELRNIQLKLSTIEADILNFFCTEQGKNKPYYLIDHAGRGKSTLLKYISYYLPTKLPSLKNTFLTVYISLRPSQTILENLNSPNESQQLIDELLKERFFIYAKNHLIKNTTEVLTWITNNYRAELQGTFYPELIEEWDKDCEKQLALYINTNDSQKVVNFIIGIMSHYSNNVKPIALFIDDADNFSCDIQKNILRYAKDKMEAGFYSLISLRHSSWHVLENSENDYEFHKSTRITWNFDNLKNLLLKRIRFSKDRRIRIDTEHLWANASGEDMVSAFFDILKNKETIHFLIKTSNYNLHSLMKKISNMAYSWHFNDKFLLREALMSNTKVKPSVWNVFDLIFGSYRGTFKSTSEVAKYGSMNLFCTLNQVHQPYTFFIRLHYLSRLTKYKSEKNALKVNELLDDYSEVLGANGSDVNETHYRTIFRLIQCSLVNTKSYRKYDDISEVKETINNDSIYLTDAGMHYLTWVLMRFDYLYFMKDDIDWPEKMNIRKLQVATVGNPKNKKISQSLIALSLLMQLELEMLEKMAESKRNSGDAILFKRYVSMFSAQESLGHTSILFSENIYQSYIKFIDNFVWNKRSEFSEELEQLEIIRGKSRNILERYVESGM